MEGIGKRLKASLPLALCISLFASGAALAGSPRRGHRAGRGHIAGHRRTAPLGGINIGGLSSGKSPAVIDAEVAAAHRLHARLVRVEMPWADFQPKSAGRVSVGAMAAADALMRDLSADHMKAIALVDRTPCWASSAPAALMRSCAPGESMGGAHAWPPSNPSAYALFVGWLAERYGSRLAAIEVWNEPDQVNQAYFAGPNKPQRYASLLRAAYPAIKHADPHVKVLAGSLVGSNGAFMNALYEAGIKGYYDGVAVHFYTLGLGGLRAFRENQLRHGDRKPLWFDEFGWTSCWPKEKIQQEQACVTRRAQARNIANYFKEIAHTKWVAAMLPYELSDTSRENFGVLGVSGRRKPSFFALAKALRSPFGHPTPITLKLKRESGQVIASGSAPVGDYMKLEAFQHGQLRYKAIFTLNRFNRYRLALPSVLGVNGLTVRVWQYWWGREHGAKRSI